QLTPEQQASLAQWNSLGAEISDQTMMKFYDSWFSNIRSLIKADFPIHNIKELANCLGRGYKTFTILGSGPSAQEIARRLPSFHEAIFCSPTCLGALGREGIRPTALIVADSNPQQYLHVKESLSR